MTTELEPSLKEQIAAATDDLAIAQAELLEALGDLENKERADKTMISAVLRDVLEKVAAAKRRLGALLKPDPPEE